MTASSKSPRRWFRFSLRTLLLACAAVAAWLGWWIYSSQQQRDAVANIRTLTNKVFIDYSYQCVQYNPLDARPQSDPNAVSWVPRPALEHFGEDFFHNVVAVNVLRGSEGKELELAAQLARLRDLRHLIFIYVDTTDAMLARLVGLRELESLEIRGESLTDDSLRMVSGLPRLQTLDVRGPFTDAGLANLTRLRKLKSLKVESPHITDVGLAHLAKLPRLERLSLNSKRITGDGIAHLAACTKLRELLLPHSSLTDDDLSGFASLTSLQRLDLLGNKLITGTGFEHLTGLTNLQRLYLTNTRTSDHAILFLARLPDLEKLDLGDTHVTLAGLEQLKDSPKLRRLVVSMKEDGAILPGLPFSSNQSKGLSSSELKLLQQALPRCRIDEFRDF